MSGGVSRNSSRASTKRRRESARQLVGASLVLGRSGASVLRHFIDSVILFLLGRALQFLLERINPGSDQLQLVHLLSKWYETAIFGSFAVFSCIEIWHGKYREMRRMDAAQR